MYKYVKDRDYLEYACEIVQAASEAEYSDAAVFNGLALATASKLLDFVVSEDGETIDDTDLFIAVQKYINTLSNAVQFAKQQFEASKE